MRRLVFFSFMVMLALIAVFPVVAGEETPMGQEKETASSSNAMPPMGPTDEIKSAAYLVGTWDVKGNWTDLETGQTNDFEAIARYSYVVDGAALQMTYESEMMGMPYSGLMLQAFDRETKKWKTVWTDSMGSTLSYMEGEEIDGNLVFMGKDHWQGQEYLNRITVSKRTDKSFDWKMEHSMDGGTTYSNAMSATYTKR